MLRRVLRPLLGTSAQEHIQEGTTDVDTRTYTGRYNRCRHKNIYRKVQQMSTQERIQEGILDVDTRIYTGRYNRNLRDHFVHLPLLEC